MSVLQMNEVEISKALALAIGHTEHTFITASLCLVYTGHPHDKVRINGKYWVYNHRIFDYRSWAVAGPIAERYDCFPSAISTGNFRKSKAQGYTDVEKWEVIRCNYAISTEQRAKWERVVADTPQKAIAMAVIQGVTK